MTMHPSEAEVVVPTDELEPPSAGDEFGMPSRSQGRQALRLFFRSPLAVIALVVFVLIVGTAYIGPYVYKWNFKVADLRPAARSAHPGHAGHILGTDGTGFDLLSQLMRGTQRDVIIMFVSSVVALLLGILVGSVAGYYGSLADNVLMRFVDIMLTIPSLVILIIACARYPNTAGTAPGIALLFGLFGWMGLSRLVRAQFLTLREREFVEASHAMGASNFRIIFRHLIPNAMGTILVFATLFAATSIVVETSLTYLGYGVHPPDTSLGLLVSSGVDAADTRPWLFYYPGILILIIVLAVNLIGEGIRNAFDPRNNRVRD
jgi:ABC-type dipeptide/oligopeptide/nickel transport system permease subunit